MLYFNLAFPTIILIYVHCYNNTHWIISHSLTSHGTPDIKLNIYTRTEDANITSGTKRIVIRTNRSYNDHLRNNHSKGLI